MPDRFLAGLGYAAVLGASFFLPYVALLPGWGFFLNGLYLLDWQRIFQCLALLSGLLVFAVLCFRKPKAFPTASRTLLLWCVLGVSGLWSVAIAERPVAALLDWGWMNGLVVMILLVAHLFYLDYEAFRDSVLKSALIATLLYLFWFFVSNTDYLFSYDFRFTEPNVVGFSNSRYFSDFQAVLLFLAPAAWGLLLPESRWRWAALVLIGLMFSLAFYVGSRSVLLGQLVAHAVLFAVLGKRYGVFFLRIAACWVIGFGIYVGLFLIYVPWSQSPGSTQEEQVIAHAAPLTNTLLAPQRLDSSGRDELLLKAWRLIKERPLFGVGGRHYGCYLKADFNDPYNRFNGDMAHPHNALIQLAVEWGVAQALLAAGMLVYLLNRLRCRLRDLNSVAQFEMAMAGSLLVLLAHGMANGVINAPVTQTMLALFLGWSAYKVSQPVSEIVGKPRVGYALCVFASGLAVLISVVFLQELVAVPEVNRSYIGNDRPTSHLAPRFWQQGWLLPLCGRI
ncbi:MAG: pilus biosis protein [Rhodocyclaceae bacterium]|nr:pilus biosis protein [Rhodocyclaceae bacterium]